MPRDELDRITEGEQAVADRVDQVPMLAAGEVRAPNGPLEQDVPDLGQTSVGIVKDDVARGVAGTVDDLQGSIADGHAIPSIQPLIGTEGRDRSETEHPRLLRQGIKQEGIINVRTQDRHPQTLGQLGGAADVVDMTVGEEDLDGGNRLLPYQCQEATHLSARVHDGRLTSVPAPEQRAILLERSDRHDTVVQRLVFATGYYLARSSRRLMTSFVRSRPPSMYSSPACWRSNTTLIFFSLDRAWTTS
jgi:hypothetical protein